MNSLVLRAELLTRRSKCCKREICWLKNRIRWASYGWAFLKEKLIIWDSSWLVVSEIKCFTFKIFMLEKSWLFQVEIGGSEMCYVFERLLIPGNPWWIISIGLKVDICLIFLCFCINVCLPKAVTAVNQPHVKPLAVSICCVPSVFIVSVDLCYKFCLLIPFSSGR